MNWGRGVLWWVVVPACAGMTERGAEMTERGAGMEGTGQEQRWRRDVRGGAGSCLRRNDGMGAGMTEGGALV